MNLLLATATFFYTISGTSPHQACYQKVGATAPTCLTITESTTTISNLEDDVDYDFWARIGGVDSIKTRVRTQKKTVLPPAIVIAP